MRPQCIEHTLLFDPLTGGIRPHRRPEPYPTTRVRFNGQSHARSTTPAPSRSTSSSSTTAPTSNNAHAASSSASTTPPAARSSSATPRTPPTAASTRTAPSPSATPQTIRSVLRKPRASPAPIESSDDSDSDMEVQVKMEVVLEQSDSDSDDYDDELQTTPTPVSSDVEMEDGNVEGGGVVNDGIVNDDVGHATPDGDYESDLTDLDMLVRTDKIRRPPGEAGRDWSLQKVLGWSIVKYRAVRTFVGAKVGEHMDCDKPPTDQPLADMRKIREITIKKFPWIDYEYYEAWPIDDFIKSGLKYRKQRLREKKRKTALANAEAELKKAQKANEELVAAVGGSGTSTRTITITKKTKQNKNAQPKEQPKSRNGAVATRSMTRVGGK
ncbi:hypothetical protein V5O48_012686 [Marasmius crinis-equi]|uniref:Uncharacterized protein n=1 Tax=Marasmius crinis-equi TaxID=585013 RepID=A0ABR3F249_9AGAR